MARVEEATPLRPAPGVTVSLFQPERGYRFNVDSLHLIQFAHVGRPVDTLCDLGAGSGVLGISLLALGAARRGLFVELDNEQAARCARNLVHNDLTGEVVAGDVEHAAPTHHCGLVVCNPPYFAPNEGRAPRDAARTQARFGGILGFVHAAAKFCGTRGRVCFVYPAHSSLRLLEALRESGLEPKRMGWVHPKAHAPARLVLVEAKPGKPGGMVVEAARIEQL